MFEPDKIATAVITGHHEYDVVGLQTLFRSIPGVDAYPQNLEDFVTDTGNARSRYDVVVFYNYHLPTPDEEFDGKMRTALDELGETGQGILVLHHAIVAFTDWGRWDDICGMTGRKPTGGAPDQRMRIEVANSDHPITRGLASWEIIDEIYTGMGDAGEGNEVLLTTEHPGSMRTIAWTRTFGKSRVLCYQNGHDAQAFIDPRFRTVVGRGLQWLAGRS